MRNINDCGQSSPTNLERETHARKVTVRSLSRCLALTAAILVTLDPHAAAQLPDRTGDSPTIRRSARQILDAPEFRHFQRIERKPGSGGGRQPRIPGGEPGGSGKGSDGAQPGDGNNGRSGEGGPGGEGNRGRAGRGRQDRGPGGGRDERFGEGGQPGGGNDGFESDPDADQSSSDSDSLLFRDSGGGALGQAIGGLLHVIAWIGLAAVAGLLIFAIVKAIQNYERPQKPEEDGADRGEPEGELEPEQAPGELPADVYIAKARELADAGRFREAVAQLLLGGMSNIERAGLVTFRRGLTCRDYVRAVRGNTPVHKAMREMVKVYEPLGFGRREARRAHFDRALAGYAAGFRQSA